jgi:hypothetical protein
LDLPIGARLLENHSVPDLHDLDSVQFPATLLFFDSDGNHGLNFVCPMFAVAGFSIEYLHLDVMHVLDLGVSQYVAGLVFRRLIENNFARSTQRTADLKRFDNLHHLRRRMRSYYKTLKRPRGTMSAIGRLTLLMLGKLKEPRLKAKAAETRNIIPLLTQLCAENSGFLGEHGPYLAAACTELKRFYDTMTGSPRVMNKTSLAALEQSSTRLLSYWKKIGGHFVYKFHALWHIAERARLHGNPKTYWTYADEAENRAMGRVAKGLHGGRTFYSTFLEKVLVEIA